MKKITRLILIVLVPLTFLIEEFSFDLSEKNKYEYPFDKEYKLIKVQVENFSEEAFNGLYDYIINNDLILERRASRTLDDGIQVITHFSSFTNLSDYNQYFKLKNYTPDVPTIQTFGKKNLIQDFLNNDKHEFSTMDDFFKIMAMKNCIIFITMMKQVLI